MRLLTLGLVLVACDGGTGDTDDTDPATVVPTEDTDTDITFDDVHPIFQTKCGPCHVGSETAGHSIGGSPVDDAYDDSQLDSSGAPGTTKGERALARIQDGSMPRMSGCTGDPAQDDSNALCLTQAEQDKIQLWIDQGQRR